MNEKVKFTDGELLAYIFCFIQLLPRNRPEAMNDFIDLLQTILEQRFSHHQEFINPSDEY